MGKRLQNCFPKDQINCIDTHLAHLWSYRYAMRCPGGHANAARAVNIAPLKQKRLEGHYVIGYVGQSGGYYA